MSATKDNEIIAEGVEAFPENERYIQEYQRAPHELLSLYDGNPYYHGWQRDECLIVKYRRERTYDNHFLDIWICLTHRKETCRCGMEWEYYQKELYLQYAHLS